MSDQNPITNPDLVRIEEQVHFGLHMFFSGARRSGRTTAMLNRLTPDHRVIVATPQHANHLKSELRRRGMENSVQVANPKNPIYAPDSQVMRTGSCPTFADHTWIEQRLLNLFSQAISQIQYELNQVDEPPPGEAWPRAMAKRARDL